MQQDKEEDRIAFHTALGAGTLLMTAICITLVLAGGRYMGNAMRSNNERMLATIEMIERATLTRELAMAVVQTGPCGDRVEVTIEGTQDHPGRMYVLLGRVVPGTERDLYEVEHEAGTYSLYKRCRLVERFVRCRSKLNDTQVE